MKKRIYIVLVTAATVALFAGCSKRDEVVPATDAAQMGLTDEEFDVLASFVRESNKLSIDEARFKALNLVKSMDSHQTKAGAILITGTSYLTLSEAGADSYDAGYPYPDTVAYVFNFGSGDGFAIIAADLRVKQSVLAYVDHGSFDQKSAKENPGMALFLHRARNYMMNSIDESERKSVELMPVINAKLSDGQYEINTRSAIFDYNTVVTVECSPDWRIMSQIYPMIPVEWGQEYPWSDSIRYNNCPIGSASAGCTAVAAAHIMSYWEHPSTIQDNANNTYMLDWDELHTLTGGSQSSSSMYRDNWIYFSWDHVIPQNIAGPAASLMKVIGEKTDMAYSCSGSGATIVSAINMLRDYGYTGGDGVNYDYQTVKASLDAGKPLIIEGYYGDVVGDGTGHAWVIDGYIEQRQAVDQIITVIDNKDGRIVSKHINAGYEEAKLLHNNWGWEGGQNGYFAEGCFNTSGDRLPSNTRANFQYRVKIYPDITYKRPGMIQMAVTDKGYIHTTTNGWATFTERQNVGSKSWGPIVTYASDPPIQTAIGGGYIHTTTDGWATFTEQQNIGNCGYVAISSSDPLIQTVIVAGGGYIYTTTDGWVTYTQRMNLSVVKWRQVAISTTDPLIQTAIGVGSSNDYFFTTTDGWVTYTQRGLGGGPGWRWNSVVISSFDPLVQTAVGNVGLYTTTNGWATATSHPTIPGGIYNVVAISASNPLIQTVIVAGGVYIFTTTDGWATYTQRWNVGSRRWQSIAISPSDPLVQTAGASDHPSDPGYIYTTTDGWATFTQRKNVGRGYWRVAIGN